MKSSLVFICFTFLTIATIKALPSDEDMQTLYERRKQELIQGSDNPGLTDIWRNSLTAERIWEDVDYTSGCPARRANWPAQDHFQRIITMSAHFAQNVDDTDLLEKISNAMNYWFERDYLEDDCINAGGNANLNCPCDTPGLWNTNWYCQMILMPTLVGNACVLLKSNLTASQLGNCTNQLRRSYFRIDGDPNGSMGGMTGANMLDVSSIAINLALLTSDGVLLEEALGRYYNEAEITFGNEDGIKHDGGFWQHDRQLYTGNYGAVFMRMLLKIFIQTDNTNLVTPVSVQDAFLTVIDGSEWLMHLSKNEPRLLWQYSVIGRMVSFKYEDWGGIGLNLDEISLATNSFHNRESFQDIVEKLKSRLNGTESPAEFKGTRYFHVSDYLVHRGENYTVTLKMVSSRTTNSECNNNQNPFGFHLSDGAIYTHTQGSEYFNVQGAWDWNLIPGTTVDYDATVLQCGRVQHRGREPYVGAVASRSANAAVAVMNYTNPMTQSLQWSKSFFFFPNSYVVSFINDVISSTNAPIVTTLDQRQLKGPVYIDGVLLNPPNQRVTTSGQYVWHDRVGYFFPNVVNLTIDTTPRAANWSEIGISVGTDDETLFSAVVEHQIGTHNADRFTYFTYLDIDYSDFIKIRNKDQKGSGNIELFGDLGSEIKQGGSVSRGAVYDQNGERIIGLAFWRPGLSITGLEDIAAVSVDTPVVVLLVKKPQNGGWTLSVADPSQQREKVEINVYLEGVTFPVHLVVDLPQPPYAGSTVSVDF